MFLSYRLKIVNYVISSTYVIKIHRGFFSNLMSSLACWDSNSFSSASALSTAWLIFSRAPIALGIKLDCLLASCKNTKKKLKKNFTVEAKLRRLVSSLPIYLFIWESAQNLSVSVIDEYKLRSEIRLVSASLAYETRYKVYTTNSAVMTSYKQPPPWNDENIETAVSACYSWLYKPALYQFYRIWSTHFPMKCKQKHFCVFSKR